MKPGSLSYHRKRQPFSLSEYAGFPLIFRGLFDPSKELGVWVMKKKNNLFWQYRNHNSMPVLVIPQVFIQLRF